MVSIYEVKVCACNNVFIANVGKNTYKYLLYEDVLIVLMKICYLCGQYFYL